MATAATLAERLRTPPALGILVAVMLIFEKFLAHTYTVITIYVLPAPWEYWVPGMIKLPQGVKGPESKAAPDCDNRRTGSLRCSFSSGKRR